MVSMIVMQRSGKYNKMIGWVEKRKEQAVEFILWDIKHTVRDENAAEFVAGIS